MPGPPPLADQLNDRPLDDFEGLTPRLMHGLLYDFLGPGSPIKAKDELPDDLIERMPLPYFAHRLLSELAEKEIKLTQKGNLPGKLVKAYYATKKLPESIVENGPFTIRGEDDFLALHNLKIVLDLLRWTKKRRGKLSLTKKGKEALELAPRDFFRQLFLGHARRFNLAYNDAFPEEEGQLQRFLPYLVYLLQLRGREKREPEYYRKRMWRAFPQLDDPEDEYRWVAMDSRLNKRLLYFYGLIEFKEAHYRNKTPATLRATPLFHEVFYLDPDARQAPPSEEQRYETQLKTALFDADMGSQSWTSDEVPPEVLEQFQANIREFEERHAAGKTVTVGSLLGGMPILPSEEITDDEVAEREIARLLDKLKEQGILLERPEELPPTGYYHFLIVRLLDHEIVPPVPGQRLFLTFEDVMFAGADPTEMTTEGFLLAVFDLDEPFPTELLHTEMRLKKQVVSRQQALAHLDKWRQQYTHVEPIAFDLFDLPDGMPSLPPERAVCFFGVEYVATHPDGREETFRGEGVVEMVLVENQWRVSGGMFPGFAF